MINWLFLYVMIKFFLYLILYFNRQRAGNALQTEAHACDDQLINVTRRQLMRLFAVKLILSYEQKCKVMSKFPKN